MEFWNLHVSFEHCQRDFRVPVEISLVYWWYKAMNFSLHCSMKYFKNTCNNCFPSISNLFFLLMRHFWKDFQRNVQHFIHMPDITKRNPNVHFILGNTGHVWHELTVIHCWDSFLHFRFWLEKILNHLAGRLMLFSRKSVQLLDTDFNLYLRHYFYIGLVVSNLLFLVLLILTQLSACHYLV